MQIHVHLESRYGLAGLRDQYLGIPWACGSNTLVFGLGLTIQSCLLFFLAETKNRSQAPYTFRTVRTIRGCLEGLALMI
jgi:hypothetical protein